MLSVDAAHALLAERDRDLPALGQLLDAARLPGRVGVPATRSYLRYKPGTSAVALLDVGGRAAIAHHWGGGKGEKRDKALRHVTPDQVLLDDPGTGLLVLDSLADRKLPVLRTHLSEGRLGTWLGRKLDRPVGGNPTTLAHKPARRWVGRLRASEELDLTLRAYPGDGLAAHVAAHDLVLNGAADRHPVRLPRLLARHKHGLLVLEHLPGRALDNGVDDAGLRRLGAALGAFHTAGADAIAGARGEAEVVDLADCAPAVAGLFPELAAASAAVAKGARAALRSSAGTILHGDFSLDQVVADADGLGFIDLDRARVGVPADDLASLLGQAALEALLAGGGPEGARAETDRMRAPLLAGHADAWPGPRSEDLAPRTALALLRRSGEPFRAGDPDWVRVTHDIVATAAGLLRSSEWVPV